MKTWTSRRKILLGCVSMVLAILGDYLLGFGTFSMSADAGTAMGITASVVPDWRYALSSLLGFACVPLFAVGATELLAVCEKKLGLGESKLYKLFRIANWSGILYFAFIHIGICMLPVVFNAGMEATGDQAASIAMTLRVLKSIAVPMAAGFIVCDLFVAIAWIGMIAKGMLPVKKIAMICNPVIVALLGQGMNLIAEGLDSGFESFGWLLLYLVCAMKLVGKEERISGLV
ncbi:MAG: hypothetical protein IJ594_05150 [Oscillospiraceae bacterium]|nr:hypothetical protein [Oscillospiraceae bacterium]